MIVPRDTRRSASNHRISILNRTAAGTVENRWTDRRTSRPATCSHLDEPPQAPFTFEADHACSASLDTARSVVLW
jgi:hypothetical protein